MIIQSLIYREHFLLQSSDERLGYFSKQYTLCIANFNA